MQSIQKSVNLKNSNSDRVPELRFPEFEGEWEETIIKKIAIKITDGTHDTPKPINKGVPFLTAIHVKDGFIDFKNCYFLNSDEHKKIYERCNPEYGDLLMVNIGAGTATSALVEVKYQFSLKNVALIKPNRKKIDHNFFVQVQRKNSKKIKHQISSGGAQPFLSLTEIGKLKLTIPNNLQEQQKIASFLTAIDQRIQLLQQKESKLESYKKGIMQKLFSQELRFKDEQGNEFADWEEKKLGEVTDINLGQSPNSLAYNDKKIGYPLIQGNADIFNRKSRPRQWTSELTKKAEPNDLLLTVRAPVGFIAKNQHLACIGRGVCAIKSKKDFDLEFIYQFLLFYEPKWINVGQGSTFTAISGNDIRNLALPIPESLKEQEKIASFLSAIDEAIEKVGQQVAQMQGFKKGLLQGMFV